MQLKDKIKGAIFGHAIGDALGVGIEGWSKKRVRSVYPSGYSYYEQMDHFKKKWWKPGEWSDDTEQMLCILDSILEKKDVDIKDIAKRIYNWATVDGRGIGRTVFSVVFSDGFLEDPYNVSKKIWERSGKELAPNGGVMRTSVLGIWKYWDENEVIKNAEAVCKITHWDPRCVGSSVAVSYAIAELLKSEKPDVIYEKVLNITEGYDKRITSYLKLSEGSISKLFLDEPESMGYTLKAMGAGFWALLNAKDFKSGLLTVINEGGDADTNGAVCGAILGARFGFSSIPKEYISGLLKKDLLAQKAESFFLAIQNNFV